MRLIDSDALFNKICKKFDIPKDWDGDIAEPLQTIIDIIDNEPTAYDVEVVVSELQYMKENFEKDCSYWKEHSWRDNTVYNEADLNDRQADCYSDAIEIVRKGGVD